MKELKEYLAGEIPEIERALYRETAMLDPLVKPVAEYVLQAGGKRLRPFLCILTARGLGYDKADIYPLSAALEFLHSATLLHDDILDNADVRRGRPAAHLAFGNTETILSGDVLLALANKLVAGYLLPDLMRCVSEAIMHTATGEVLEVSLIGNPKLSMDDYYRIITGKTAYLIRASCECGAILAGSDEKIRDAAVSYGHNLGIAFQLVDDAMDYAADDSITGKPLGGDLREGKLTLPLIFFLEEQDIAHQSALLRKIQSKTLEDKEADDILKSIRKGGYADRTRQEAATFLDRAHKSLEVFPASPEKEMLEQALEYVRKREK